ncbi:MAG: potassium channel family protein, partial [Solirubrobacteraceae bacterium]
VAAVALRTIPVALTFAISGLISAAIPVALAGGVVRLLRDRGVTIQAVAGALSVYLLVGLLFAWAIGFIAKVQGSPYFVQQHGVDTSTATYYSFTVMTTTGLGDLTAATRVGRALAVVEMLIGQIYVVVVIGLLVGNVTGRRRVAGSEAQPPAEGA